MAIWPRQEGKGMLRVMVGVLVMTGLTGPAAQAAPEVRIGGFGFETNAFYVDVEASDLGELAGQSLTGIGIGCTLTGAGIGHLGPNAPAMRLTGPEWAGLVAPKPFAWASFDTMSSAANAGGVDDLTAFGMLDLDGTPGPVSAGELVCRFLYVWDNIYPDEGTISIVLSGDEGVAMPYFLDQNGNPVSATVGNNGLSVPEPATLALVGFGLSSALVRRRGRR